MTATTAAVITSRVRREASNRSATGTTTGAASSFTEHAAPTSSPTHTARAADGRSRYANATATADAPHAIAGPSPLMPVVTRNSDPLVVASVAATSPARRPATRRAM